MSDRALLLVLDLAEEVGALRLHSLLLLVAWVARDSEFSAPELCSHALLPENNLLRNAVVATCGEVSARRLGQLFAKWKGVDLAGLRIDAIGSDAAGILWKLSVAQHTSDRTVPADRASIIALPPLCRTAP